MPTLRFILGRAGSGKTHHCLEAIRAELRARPDGPPLILLAPEQSTFQLERALVTTPGIDGMIRAHVLSFRRLAHRLFDELGGRTIPPAGNLKRLLILKTILSRRHQDLRFYGPSARTVGFAQAVDSTLTEWRRYHFSPEEAEALAGGTPHSALARKLHDLALIERDYRSTIANRFLDPEDFLDRVAAMVERSSLLREARIWVDGFADFTALERRALIAMLRVADAAEIALCLDPATVEQANPLVSHSQRAPRPFSACERTYWRLRQEAAEAGLELLAPLNLKNAHRFLHAPALKRLEHDFFLRSRKNSSQSQLDLFQQAADDASQRDPNAGGQVRVVRAQSLQAEVEFVALEALRLAREEGLRYREMAIVTRDLDRSHDLLRTALARLRIPFFMDRQREVLCHPLAELLSSAAAVAAGGWKTPDVVQALKTGLLPIDADEADRLENHALAYGLEGEAWLDEAQWRRADFRPTLRAAMAPLAAFDEALGAGAFTTAAAFVNALRALIEATGAMAMLQEWQSLAEQAGDPETAAEHRQAPEMIEGLLAEWAEALGDERLTRRECADLLAEGLSALRLRLAPPTLDHLLVGSIERSRHPDLRVVFLLGMNTGLFPKPSSEDPLLNDADRAVLSEAGVELAPAARDRLLNEPYLAYIALTRPSERLIITYSQSDENCRAMEASPYLERIEEIVEIERQEASAALEEMKTIVDLPSLGSSVARALGRYLRHEGDAPPPDPLPVLVRMGCELDRPSQPFARRIRGVAYRNQAHLAADQASALYRRLFEDGMGVTSFETFAACPFRFFAQRGLRLKPREEARLEATDRGALLHDVLGQLFDRLQEHDQGWHDVEASTLENWMTEIFDECSRQFRGGLLQNSARSHILLQNLQKVLRERVRILCEEARASAFRQFAAELAFGAGKNALPPFELTLDNGVRVRLQGRVDRLDLCQPPGSVQHVRIIDYKTTSRKFDVCLALAGIQLQLPLYLLAISRGDAQGPWMPVGFFFSPIIPERQKIRKVHEPIDRGNDPFLAAFKGDGLVADCYGDLVDSTLGNGSQKSNFWNLTINNDGSWRKGCDAIDQADLDALLAYVERILQHLAQRVLTGECAVAPYEYGKQDTACRWCEFNGVCRFDPLLQRMRTIQKMKREEAFEAMRDQA